MAYFPFFVDLTDKTGLILGGGTVACRKIRILLAYGPKLTVVAPDFHPQIEALSREFPEQLTLCRRSCIEDDLKDYFFVIAATDDPALNHRIAIACKTQNIPINVVDDKNDCSFLFPALIKDGDLTIGISTSGDSPTAAAFLKKEVEQSLPEEIGTLLPYLASLRPLVKERIREECHRKSCFAKLLSLCLEQGFPLSPSQLETILREYFS